MKIFIGICLLVFFPTLYMLPVHAESPYRSPNVDYRFYLSKQDKDNVQRSYVKTPVRLASLYPRAKLRDAVKWPSYSALVKYFNFVRDSKFIKHQDQLRRISWLYPDNGCYVRAALVTKLLKKPSIPVKAPDKIFVFGNLKALTPNSPEGQVSWWYHVAPVVQVDKQKYVLDPGLDPSRPLKLEEWLALMGDPALSKVAICASGTYLPRSNCLRTSDGKERLAQSAQKGFLDLEWERLLFLERDPVKELGDSPPWRSHASIMKFSE